MAAKPADFSNLIFRRSSVKDIGEISLDGKMLAVLSELDGRRSLSAVAGRLRLNGVELLKVVSRLLNMKLIVPVENAGAVLTPEFINDLYQALAVAVGPVAKLLLEETAAELGYGLMRIPCKQAPSLVERLADEISRDDKKITFEKRMLKKISALKS